MEPIARTTREGELLEQLAWLQALARSLVRDAASADDLVQDTWIAASKHAPATDERGLRNWLATVARNFARRNARSQQRRARRETAAARPEAHVDDVVARGELQRQLAAAVMSLDEPERSAVLMRYLDGLSSVEIAERQGVSHVAARKRISRGLAELRTKLDAQHGGNRNAWIVALHSWVGHGGPVAGTSTAIVSGVLAMLGKPVAAAALVAAAWFGWNWLGSEVSEARVEDVARVDSDVEAPRETAANTEGDRTATELVPGQRPPSLRLVDELGAARSGFSALLLDDVHWIATKLSDADGRIEIPGAPRPTALIVAREGFLPMRFELSSVNDAESLVVPSREKVSGRLLYSSTDRLSRLELTDDRENPAFAKLDSRALQELERLGISNRRRVVALDDSGVFEFDGLDANWTGAVELPESWRFVYGAGAVVDSRRALLLLGPAIQLEVPVRGPLAVRGRVVEAGSNRGLADVTVLAYPRLPSDPETLFTKTRADGEFELRIPTPDVAVSEWVATLRVFLGEAGTSRNLRVEWSQLERAGTLGDFELDLGRRLDLKVLDTAGVPIAGAVASLLPERGESVVESAPTNAAGWTALTALPAEWRRLWVDAVGYSRVEVVAVDAGPVEVRLSACNRIDVTVVTESGGPAAGAMLRVRSSALPFVLRDARAVAIEESLDFSLGTDGFGRCVLDDLLPGARLTLSVLGDDAIELARREVEAPLAGQRLDVELTIPEVAGKLRGRVIDEDGRPLPRARVTLESARGGVAVTTDADGRFRTESLVDELSRIEHLEVRRAGFVPIVRNDVRLSADDELVFILERGHALDALVLDARGRPIDSRLLLAVFEERVSVLGTPLGDGRYHFDAVPNVAGELQLELGGVTHSAPIGESDTLVRLTLPATGELQLTVAPGTYDPGSMVCVLVQRADADAEPTRNYFRKRDGELEPQALSLPEGRYRIQLESRVLGGGTSKVKALGVQREVQIVAGRLLALTLP